MRTFDSSKRILAREIGDSESYLFNLQIQGETMAELKKFGAKDIGGELLPVITKGLYRDPLDTLREYIQNAIDAKAKQVEIQISQDLVSVRDDGTGMTKAVAEKAIRLGMSEKDPIEDVGFRGIGVYSAFNICNKLEIYTKPEKGVASKLVFEFAKIRKMLKDEEDRRMNGEPSQLYLEKLLGAAVWVEDCDQCPVENPGTLVMMVGIQGNVYKRLVDRREVIGYLEGVVPLPFRAGFKHKNRITAKFEEEDYRVIPLGLTIHGHKEQLFRPYHDSIFTHRTGFGPRFFQIKNKLGKGKLGFAWVCLNDARKYLPEKNLRGLLIKKFGFSVGGRDAFVRFFSRAVFNNRITGEIIIQNDHLIPNAARTEFEPNEVRDSLYMGFAELAAEISSWANQIQDELKAQEELQTISPRVFQILREIPGSERDVVGLLRLNTTLAWYEKSLNLYRKTLEKLQKDLLKRTLDALAEGKRTIEEILASKKEGSKEKRERRTKAGRVRSKAPAQEELVYAGDKPKKVLDVVALIDMEINEETRSLIEYLDQEVIKQKMTEGEYSDFLEDLVGYLEENL